MQDKPLTPQQEVFLKSYTNPKSETWGNAYKSALSAGYSEEYSQNITGQMPDWLSENISDTKFLVKANKNLELALDGLLDDPEKGAKQIQYKATEFVQKSLNRKKFGDSVDHTTNGKDMIINIVEYGADK